MKIDIYGHGVDTDTVVAGLPASVVATCVVRTMRHVLGNEVASKAKAWRDRFAKDNNGTPPSESEEDAFVANARVEAMAKFTDGTLGVRAPGEASADPFEAAVERIAKERVKTIITANGLKWVYEKTPEGKRVKGSEARITLTDGAFTMDELVARHLANETPNAKTGKTNKQEVEELAKKELAARDKKIAAMKDVTL